MTSISEVLRKEYEKTHPKKVHSTVKFLGKEIEVITDGNIIFYCTLFENDLFKVELCPFNINEESNVRLCSNLNDFVYFFKTCDTFQGSIDIAENQINVFKSMLKSWLNS